MFCGSPKNYTRNLKMMNDLYMGIRCILEFCKVHVLVDKLGTGNRITLRIQFGFKELPSRLRYPSIWQDFFFTAVDILVRSKESRTFIGSHFVRKVKVSIIGKVNQIHCGCKEYWKYIKLTNDFEERPLWKETNEYMMVCLLRN